MATRDYYIVLGVSRTESSGGIREAFRKLAKKYHPDLGGPESTDTFQEIARAYEILSDPEQRRTYDQTLSGSERLLRAEPLKTAQRQHTVRPEPLVLKPMSIMHDDQAIRPSFDTLFESIFRNFSGIGTTKAECLRDLNVEVILTPREAAIGAVAPIAIPVFRACRSCDGTGREWFFLCVACGGQGMIGDHETVSVRIPPMVRDRSVIELALGGLGLHNFYLRLHIRIY
jgi:DnaJ-class molecular chaperone